MPRRREPSLAIPPVVIIHLTPSLIAPCNGEANRQVPLVSKSHLPTEQCLDSNDPIKISIEWSSVY